MNKKSLLGACVVALLAACASAPGDHRPLVSVSLPSAPVNEATRLRWLDRVSWGANASSDARLAKRGLSLWMRDQLNPRPAPLPPAAQAQIDAMAISRTPLDQLVSELDAQRKAADALPDEEQKKAARQAYQQQLNQLAREAQQRFVLRALYSPNQLQEQMTWFWMNHFNVNLRKDNIRAMVGDYEENAIRPHALGRFRDLLGATLHHPAMLRYLDNAQNGANRINENYARELMELHTLGVGGGYSQADVQELARVLTGVGVSLQPADVPPPNVRPAVRADYVRKGLFEFNPNRHDYGPKTLLGHCIHLTHRECEVLAATRSVAVWCPTSNLFIGSGLFDHDRLHKHGARIAVATDVGGGTSYSMLRTLDEGYKVLQLRGQRLNPLRSFYMMTLGNARALSLEPDFVVADEPVSALDVSIRAQVVNLLQDIQERLGITYLFIGHDLSVVRHISHRIAVMYAGKIVEVGTRDEIYENPKHPYTQALLSAVPIPDPRIEATRKRISISGAFPDLLRPPGGCRFHTRCPIAVERCSDEEPPLESKNGAHRAACWLT